MFSFKNLFKKAEKPNVIDIWADDTYEGLELHVEGWASPQFMYDVIVGLIKIFLAKTEMSKVDFLCGLSFELSE